VFEDFTITQILDYVEKLAKKVSIKEFLSAEYVVRDVLLVPMDTLVTPVKMDFS
jgi:hypothetical protein